MIHNETDPNIWTIPRLKQFSNISKEQTLPAPLQYKNDKGTGNDITTGRTKGIDYLQRELYEMRTKPLQTCGGVQEAHYLIMYSSYKKHNNITHFQHIYFKFCIKMKIIFYMIKLLYFGNNSLLPTCRCLFLSKYLNMPV